MLKLISEVTQIRSPYTSKINEFLTNQREHDFHEQSILTELRKKVSREKAFDTVTTTAHQHIRFQIDQIN
jgi:hypothetical protein